MARKNAVPSPKTEYLLNYPLWEVHEAAYILADSWPDNLVFYGIPSPEAEVIGGRGLYAPNGSFNLKSMDAGFKRIFKRLIIAVENGEIPSLYKLLFINPDIYGSRMSYVLRPKDVITWALVEGFNLPKSLSEPLGIYQIKCKEPSKNIHNSVRIRIVSQYVLSENCKFNVEDICAYQGWMKKFGSSTLSARTIRRAIDMLFDSEGKPGRQPDIAIREGARTYIPKPMPDVFQIDASGRACYCFSLFKTVIITAFDIKREKIGQDTFLELTPLEFQHLLLNDKTIRMYLRGTSSLFVQNLIMQLCLEKITGSFHYKMFRLPPEEFRSMKIKQLNEMNCEFVMERFTKEEREKISKVSSS